MVTRVRSGIIGAQRKPDLFNTDFSSDLHLISEAEVRHKYGRACISAPKPTTPSTINTSSPITIQPCNAVMFSSLRIDGAGPTGPQLKTKLYCPLRLVRGDDLARKRYQQCPPVALE